MHRCGCSGIWYFTFGALMNRTSLRMRGVVPAASQAAKLPGYSLGFRGSMGMASAIPGSATDAIYGVAHCISSVDRTQLDASEASYTQVSATVFTVEEELLHCLVNVMRPELCAEARPPSERYLALLIEGCVQHGVDNAWVAQLRATPCTPRPTPAEFACFPSPQSDRLMSLVDLAMEDGLCFAVNGKVLRFVGDVATAVGQAVRRQIEAHGIGRDHTLPIALEYYDPIYGAVASLGEMTMEHRCFTEHMIASQYHSALPNFEVIAWLDDATQHRCAL